MPLPEVITSLLAMKELKKGAKAYLVHVTSRKGMCKEVVVREFLEIFEELSGMPPRTPPGPAWNLVVTEVMRHATKCYIPLVDKV